MEACRLMTLTPKTIVQDVTETYPKSALPAWFWKMRDGVTIFAAFGSAVVVAANLYMLWKKGQWVS
jgi:hypothetical protein